MKLLDSSGLNVVAAGTTQATATLLINGLNGITTAAASSGVILSAATTSDCQVVYNGGANPVSVYPPVGYRINGLAINGAMVLATNTACQFWFLSDTRIIGILSA